MPAFNDILRRIAARKVLLWRCFWALVLLLHAPITWRVLVTGTAQPASFASIVLLLLANAFFLLEACRPCCIRLITDRRSAIAFVLIIALLHAGVLERGFPTLAAAMDQGSSLLFAFAGSLLLARYLKNYVVEFRRRCGNFRNFTLWQYLIRLYSPALAPQVLARPSARRRGPPA